MRKPRAKLTPYAIYYRDGSYLIYDLTKDDYDALFAAIGTAGVASLSVGLLVTEDIRSVILQKPAPILAPDKPAVPDMTAEEREWYTKALAEVHDTEDGEVDYQ